MCLVRNLDLKEATDLMGVCVMALARDIDEHGTNSDIGLNVVPSSFLSRLSLRLNFLCSPKGSRPQWNMRKNTPQAMLISAI